MTKTLSLIRPDDWHLHLRDGAMLNAVCPETARHFGRAIAMPNILPPVITGTDAVAYRERILAARQTGSGFMPLMTLYLTENTDPADVAAAYSAGTIAAVKLYPAGATTNSDSGVRDFDKIKGVLERMAEIGCPLLVHGEVTDEDVDIFDREAAFVDRVLDKVLCATPGLKVVLEHITSEVGIEYVKSRPKDLGGTITTHHLVITRNHILDHGLSPFYYCLPVAKRESDRLALRAAATSGDPRFFFGTDSAPHAEANKLKATGAAGCFTAPIALSILTHVFEQEGALDKLEGFASRHGPAFYGLPMNEDTITLTKSDTPVDYPKKIQSDDGPVSVFDPGFNLFWQVSS